MWMVCGAERRGLVYGTVCSSQITMESVQQTWFGILSLIISISKLRKWSSADLFIIMKFSKLANLPRHDHD